jgi:hypothetical protein
MTRRGRPCNLYLSEETMNKMEFCVERLKFKSKSELVSYLVDRYYDRARSACT